MRSLRRSAGSFRYALAGLRYLFTTQPNARIHLVAAFAAVGLGWMLRLTAVELAILVLTIGFVLAAEAFNTAMEGIVDLMQPSHHRVAGLAKDLSAAAVLVAAGTSVVVGALLFVPRLMP